MALDPIDLLADKVYQRLKPELENLAEKLLTRGRPLPVASDRPGVDWLSNADALAALRVSRTTLARWRESGRLRFSKVGKLVFYHRADVEALLNEARTTDRAASAPPPPMA